MKRADAFGIGLIVVILLITFHLAGKNSDDGAIQRLVHMVRPPVPKTITFGTKTYRLTKRIKIVKDTSNQVPSPNAKPDWRAINVAAVYAFGDRAVQIPASALSSIKLSSTLDSNYGATNAVDSDLATYAATAANDSMAALTLTFKDDMWIERVYVLGTRDNPNSLIGAKLILEDAAGAPIWMGVYSQPTGQTFDIKDQLPTAK